MKAERIGGTLDYSFDSTCPNWDAARLEELSTKLMIEFRHISEIGFRFLGQRSISITRLHLLDPPDRELLTRKADRIYKQVMQSSQSIRGG